MAENQQQQKKQFSVPNRDQLVQQIKDLDQEFQHVTLNLIKCDFNATEKDIEKTFPDFKFVKIKNYNPGSFQVVFQMKIDAINFIRNHYDKKILSRRFFIKMGRQHKQNIQDWTGVGYAPRQFKGPQKPHIKKQGYQKTQKNEKKDDKAQQKTEEQKPKQTTSQVTQQVKSQTKPVQEQKKQGKHIPKTETYQKKPYGQRKFNKNYENQGQKKVNTENNKPEYKKYENKNQKKQYIPYKKEEVQPKKEQVQPKKEQVQPKKQQVQPKKQQVQQPKKQVQPKKEDAKKQVKKDDKNNKKQEPQKPQPVEQKKQQDEGWNFVKSKNSKKR